MTPPSTVSHVTPTPWLTGTNLSYHPRVLTMLAYALQPYAGLTHGSELELTAAALHALVTEAREEA